VINPQTSTSLKGASNSQTVCMRHSDLHQNATVYAQVRDWVGGKGMALVASAATP
jgi:triacylglycerol lipase